MRVDLATLQANATAAENEPTDHAAFHALTTVQRNRIASTVTPISAQITRINRAIDEAQELEQRVWAATPRDRRPEARRLFQSLQTLSVAKVKATLVARLRHALQRTLNRERRSSSTTRTPRTTSSRRVQTSATPAADPSPSSSASLSADALGRLRTETPRHWRQRALIGGTAS